MAVGPSELIILAVIGLFVVGPILLVVVLVRASRSSTPPPVIVPAALPGWYPDPMGTGRQRYYDGQRWTDHQTT